MNKDEKLQYIEYLEKILKVLEVGYKTIYNEHMVYGLCSISSDVGCPYPMAYNSMFKYELAKLADRRNVFYTIEGNKSERSSQFIWDPTNPIPRIKFVNKLIEQLR